MWPVPLFILAYLAPESPWNAVRRQKIDLARKSLARLVGKSDDQAHEVECSLAYIIYTNDQEQLETEGARLIDCFRGTNLRRTEIVICLNSSSMEDITDIHIELCRLGCSNSLR